MSSNICCCDTLLFNGHCHDGKGKLIATCFNTINTTVATCYANNTDSSTTRMLAEDANTTGVDVSETPVIECFMSECPLAEIAKKEGALIPQYVLFIVGSVLFLMAVILLSLRARKQHERLKHEKKQKGEEEQKTLSRMIRRKFMASNTKFALRTFTTLGVEMLVLGGISGNYYATLYAIGGLQFIQLLYVLWKTYFLIKPGWKKGYKKWKNETIPNWLPQIIRDMAGGENDGEGDSEGDENKGEEDDNSEKEHEGKDDKRENIEKACDEEIASMTSTKSELYKKIVVSPADVYDDFTTPIARVLLLFVCQITLLVLYITAIYVAGSADFTRIEPYLFFTVGVLVQISYQEATGRQPGTYFKHKQKFWAKVMNARITDEKGRKNVHYREHETIHKVSRASLAARIYMSSLVNYQGTSMLMYLLPLHLSHSENAIDFVLNAVAAYVIVELDDVFETEKIELVKSEQKSAKAIPETARTFEDSVSSGSTKPRQRNTVDQNQEQQYV